MLQRANRRALALPLSLPIVSMKQNILIFQGNSTLKVEKILQEAQQVSKAIL